ncbi:MAG: hypothetical protein C5B50_12820 [Verrucomicrobia bacterium]|nr:MAG: hypothetical protein C5B50_12820 [Verrucomicrobiota bacterium]
MGVTSHVLNEALRAYVLTFPNRKRLMEHIKAAGLSAQTDEIVSKLDAVLKTAEDHLYNYPGGVPWGEAFERDYHALLLGQHPWLDTESLGRIHGFSGWLCWHEGLNANS